MVIFVAFITQRTGTWKNLSTTIKANTTHPRHSAYVYSGNSPPLYINKTGAPYSFARCRFEIFQVSSSGQSIMRSNVSLPFLRQMLCTSTTRDGNIAFHIYIRFICLCIVQMYTLNPNMALYVRRFFCIRI